MGVKQKIDKGIEEKRTGRRSAPGRGVTVRLRRRGRR